MSDIAIRVEHLSKRYRLGEREPYKSLREVISRTAASPINWLRARSKATNGPDYLWALDDISLEIKQGEAVGIIGRNGAGKSTLLKILSRITKPTKGRAEIYGRVGSLLEVGTGFHPELTGRENIYLNGAILGMKRKEIERRFDEIVTFAEIEKFLDTPVKRYSSGMYVRLAFAVAAHLEPEILLVDEVLAVGDIAFQKKCLGKMGEVALGGRTVLLVSHSMDSIRKLCSKAILLKSGIKDKEGLTDAVIEEYLVSGSDELCHDISLPAISDDIAGRGLKLSFLTADGVPKAQFCLGECWHAVLEFEIFRTTPHVIAAIGLGNFDSVPLITYWSSPKDLLPGRYKVEFQIDVPLAKSDVRFAVGLSSYERTFYFLKEIGHVSISDIAIDNQPVRASGTGLLVSFTRNEIVPL